MSGRVLLFLACVLMPWAVRAQELTLEACYQEALLHDPAILAAQAAFEDAAGTKILLQARALPVLQIGFLAGQQGPRHNEAGPQKAQNFFLFTANFNQPLFDAAIPASFRRGRIALALAQQQFNRAVLAELYALRIDFYTALEAKEGIEIQESIRSRLEANLKAQEEERAVGKVSNREVSQARQQLAANSPPLGLQRSSYLKTRIDLAQRLGRDLSAAQTSLSDPMDPAVGTPIPSGRLEPATAAIDYPEQTAFALAHRPDILALRTLIDAAKEDSAISHDGYYPVVNFVGNGQLIPQSAIQKSGTVVQAGDTTETTEALFGPGFTWVPIDGGMIRGQTQVIDAQRQGYEIDLKRLEQDVPRQLEQVDAALHAASAQLEGSEQNIALADRNLKQVEAQVQNGDLPQLDFLNAQSNLLQARLNRLRALLQNNIAIAQFDVITGRYLEFIRQPSTTP